jgi:hypothetical protein
VQIRFNRRIPLLANDGIWLYIAAGLDEAHFPTLFRTAWDDMLPETAKAAIRAQWRMLLSQDPDRWLVGLTDQLDQRPDSREYGMCEQDTCRLLFQAQAMLGLSPAVAMCIIGHELAHAFLTATDNPDAQDEDAVDRLADSWGFPMNAIRRRMAGGQ